MAKKPNLAETFRVDETELQPKPEIVAVDAPTAAEAKPPKKKHIGGYFPMDVYQQMKVLCAEQGLTTQEFLRAGVNAVFRMHDKPPIA